MGARGQNRLATLPGPGACVPARTLPWSERQDQADRAASAAVDPEPAPGRWTLVYDGRCAFCRWSAAQVRRLDRAGVLAFATFDEARKAGWLAGMPDEEMEGSWHLVAPDGRAWSAGAAVPMLAELLGGRLAAAPFRLPGAPWLTDAAYAWVARHRAVLGRWLRA